MHVQWLILADRADVVSGKLYLMGGGWTRLFAGEFPLKHNMGIAIGVGVPWEQTNQPHKVKLDIQDEDAHVQSHMEADFEVGRPPGLTQGQAQIFQFAANVQAHVETAGRFVVVAMIDGEEKGRAAFDVVPRPGVVPPPRKQPAT